MYAWSGHGLAAGAAVCTLGAARAVSVTWGWLPHQVMGFCAAVRK